MCDNANVKISIGEGSEYKGQKCIMKIIFDGKVWNFCVHFNSSFILVSVLHISIETMV